MSGDTPAGVHSTVTSTGSPADTASSIDNDDPADNGAFQQTPPGLVVGVGEMSKLILRLRPYRLDFKGRGLGQA